MKHLLIVAIVEHTSVINKRLLHISHRFRADTPGRFYETLEVDDMAAGRLIYSFPWERFEVLLKYIRLSKQCNHKSTSTILTKYQAKGYTYPLFHISFQSDSFMSD